MRRLDGERRDQKAPRARKSHGIRVAGALFWRAEPSGKAKGALKKTGLRRSQLFSGTNYVSPFFWWLPGCPTKNGFQKKGSLLAVLVQNH